MIPRASMSQSKLSLFPACACVNPTKYNNDDDTILLIVVESGKTIKMKQYRAAAGGGVIERFSDFSHFRKYGTDTVRTPISAV